jgi:hypothetical protein
MVALQRVLIFDGLACQVAIGEVARVAGGRVAVRIRSKRGNPDKADD